MIISRHFRHSVALVTVLVCVCLAVSAEASSAASKSTPAEGWGALAGHGLNSVAWSPGGDRIAFAAPSKWSDDLMAQAGIWVVPCRNGALSGVPVRLVNVTYTQGIPAALFWVTDSQIAWATAGTHGDFAFNTIKLTQHTPHRLVDFQISGIFQARGMAGPFCGPDDVSFDSGSQTLVLTGLVDSSSASTHLAWVYGLRTKVLTVVPLSKQAADEVTLCGRFRNGKATFYVSSNLPKESTPIYVLWRSDSIRLNRSAVICTRRDPGGAARLEFPRISPDGKRLAWLQNAEPGSVGRDQIVVYDLQTKAKRIVATIPTSWVQVVPPMGCPFSWSPDGKRIAYADGSRIKIVDVPQHIGGAK